MSEHSFLFEQKDWLGEGKIHLSMVEDELKFYTRWNLGSVDPSGQISALQEIQIQGITDVMHNQFLFKEFSPTSFIVELENATLGVITGKGVIKKGLIAWEYRNAELGFEGFEFYELQEDGSYWMRGEYATDDQSRTWIQGRIWHKGRS